MRRLIVGFAGSLLLVLLSATHSAGQTGKTFTGEITDEKLNCSQNPMKAPAEVSKDKAACILYYVKYMQPASKYVLYDAATKTTYQLDNQEMVQPFIGAKVKVTGTESNQTIKVTKIMVDDAAYKAGSKS